MPMRAVLSAARQLVRARRRMRGPLQPSWDEHTEAWARVLHHYAKRSTALPLSFQRRALSLMPTAPLPADVREERVEVGGVPARVFHLEGAGERWIYYLHGGGYSIGSVDSHRDLIVRLARAADANAFAIDYRLAPEHPFPAALDDARAGWRWLLERVDPKSTVIAGESAGGGLTIATALALRDAREALPAGLVTLSPWADLTLRSPSIDANARYDYLSRAVLETYVRRYTSDPEHPLVSPVFAELSGLPPLLVQAGGAEALCDDAVELADRAERAGVATTLHVYPEMIHVWQMLPWIPAAREATAEIGAFVREVTGAELTRQAG